MTRLGLFIFVLSLALPAFAKEPLKLRVGNVVLSFKAENFDLIEASTTLNCRVSKSVSKPAKIIQETLFTFITRVGYGPEASLILDIAEGELEIKAKMSKIESCSYDLYLNGVQDGQKIWGAYTLAGSRVKMPSTDVSAMLSNANLNHEIEERYSGSLLRVDQDGVIQLKK